jgi:hypothetical protein
MNGYYSTFLVPRSNGREFYNILCALNRRCELQRLVKWAEQKKLSNPLKLYQNRLADEEKRLFRYRLQFPHLATCASLLHQLTYILFPAPRYLAKGTARAYRYGVA